jgi:hypothetical protein
MFNVDFFVFSDGIIEMDEMGLKFLPYPSLSLKGRGKEEKLIPKPNSIFHLYFLIFGHRNFKPD